METDQLFMMKALAEAGKSYKEDEVPIGAVIVKDGKVIARAHNKREQKQMATAHAEILAIEKACKKTGYWRLEGCTLYVTLEPCPMCAGACILSRIDRVVFGAYDPKGGSIESCMKMYEQPGYNHYPQTTGGVLEEECSTILKEYFREKRKKKVSALSE